MNLIEEMKLKQAKQAKRELEKLEILAEEKKLQGSLYGKDLRNNRNVKSKRVTVYFTEEEIKQIISDAQNKKGSRLTRKEYRKAIVEAKRKAVKEIKFKQKLKLEKKEQEERREKKALEDEKPFLWKPIRRR